MSPKLLLLAVLLLPVAADAQHWESSYGSAAELAPTLDAFKRANPEGHRILADGTFDAFTLDERIDFLFFNLFEYNPEKGLKRAHQAVGKYGYEEVPSEGITDKVILRGLEAHNSILRRIESGEDFFGCYEAKEFFAAYSLRQEDFDALWPLVRDQDIKLGLLDPNCR